VLACPKAWDVLVEEASKIQLLCKSCHVAKGAEDKPELKHGTYHVYWYWNCRYDLARRRTLVRARTFGLRNWLES
jgi:hypothetical protein